MIYILLSTYNGAQYLPEFLDSLKAQINQDWALLVRDDGSNDNTMDIVREYQMLYPNKIEILHDDFGNLGSTKSFMLLLDSANSKYIMFADQDDVWLPDKIEVSLAKIEAMDKNYGADSPLLVFADMMVVDNNLNIIHSSFWQYQKLNPDISKDWKKLLAQNVITGCSIMINQAAKEVSLPFTIKGLMHDQWIGVNVAKHGQIEYIRTPTLLYRQHDANSVGAYQFGVAHIVNKIITLKSAIYQLYRCASFFTNVSFSTLLINKIQINLHRLFRKW